MSSTEKCKKALLAILHENDDPDVLNYLFSLIDQACVGYPTIVTMGKAWHVVDETRTALCLD